MRLIQKSRRQTERREALMPGKKQNKAHSVVPVAVCQPQHPVVLASESLEQYQTLLHKLEADFHAASVPEKLLVEKMAQSLWRKQRLHQVETNLIQTQSVKKRLEIEAASEESWQSEKMLGRKAEIRLLEASIGELDGLLEEGKRINRIRNKERFQSEAETWVWAVNEEFNQTDGGLDKFLTSVERYDSCAQWPRKTEGGEYSARRWIAKTSFQEQYGLKEEKAEPKASVSFVSSDSGPVPKFEKPLCLHSVESYRNELKKWLAKRKTEMKGIVRLQEARKECQLADSIPSLNDDQADKIQRMESFLDTQFYKALAELQKLQAFLLKKAEIQGLIPSKTVQNTSLEGVIPDKVEALPM
jgi:hypothetical protein